MHLLILLAAGVAATAAWRVYKGAYSLHVLALTLWASVLMFTVDKAYAYLVEGEAFVDASPESMALGAVLVATAIVLWLLTLAYGKMRRAG